MKSKKEVKESAMQCEEESSEDNESNTERGEDHPSTDETDLVVVVWLTLT
jgi:hypothetical protein